MQYAIRWIKFSERLHPVVLQMVNGPCPLIAICNVLFLRGQLSLPAQTAEVSFEQLVTMLRAFLQQRVQNVVLESRDEQSVAQSLQNLEEVSALLPKLEQGLDVNVHFHAVDAFEATRELALFDLAAVRLVHGWLVDPQDKDTARVLGNKSYNELVTFVASDDVPPAPDGASDEEKSAALVQQLADRNIARAWLDETQTQLTVAGLAQLQEHLRDEELAVLFRNNHFLCLYKHNHNLYVLYTDLGVLRAAPYLTWSYCSSISGDDLDLDHDFKIPHPLTIQQFANKPQAAAHYPQAIAPPSAAVTGTPAQIAAAAAMAGSAAASGGAAAPSPSPSAEQMSVLRQNQQTARELGLVWNEARQQFEQPQQPGQQPGQQPQRPPGPGQMGANQQQQQRSAQMQQQQQRHPPQPGNRNAVVKKEKDRCAVQ